MLDAFRMFAHYNRIANERLYEKCGQLDLADYRKQRQGSFGSIHALLNHLLLGDRIYLDVEVCREAQYDTATEFHLVR
jgi:uncharacterized damage-inducible protein DinB